jgi:DNA/RNA endonuclease YhcR with UshA esterase domain
MKMMFTRLLMAMLLFLIGGASVAQAQSLVAYWDQNSNALPPPATGNGFLPASFPQAASLGTGNLRLMNFNDSLASTGAYVYIQSFGGTTTNAQTGVIAGGSLSPQGGLNNSNNGMHIDLQVSLSNYQNPVLSYARQRTSTGFSSHTISYSTDGINFTQHEVDSVLPTSFGLKTFSFNGVSALTNAATVTFRITLNGATAATGNNRIDNITVVADTFSSTPITTSIVTFQVNMQYQTVGANGVRIAGNFQGWNASATPLTRSMVDTNVWSFTDTFNIGDTLQYKFINGNAWGQDESVPAACAIGGNRFYVIAAGNPTLPLVCFGSCTNCTPQRAITFRVNMTGQTVTGPVHIAGTFNNFSASADTMTPAGNNIYQRTYQLQEGVTVRYKFLNGPSFANEEIVPAACGVPNGFGGFDREYTPGNANATLQAVLFGSCNALVATPTYPLATIGSIRANDSNGVAVRNGDSVAIYGTIISHNIRPAGMQYVIKDATGGTTIFRASGNFGLGQLAIGDTLWAQGVVAQFNGLTQVAIDTAVFIGAGANVPAATLVTALDENSENELVRFNSLEIVSGTWPAAGSTSNGVNIIVRSTVDTSISFTARVIANGTTLGGAAPTTPVFDLIGVGGQFDNSNPFTSGYQLFPRAAADVLPRVVTTPVQVTFQVDMDTNTVGAGGARIAGTFNGWNPAATTAAMTQIPGTTIWQSTLTLTSGDSVQYKFLKDSTWGNDETVPAACGILAGGSVYNRLLVAPATATTLPAVVFGTCSPAVPPLTLRWVSQIKGVDANGVADSVNTRQRLSGTLHGLNHYRSGTTPVGIQWIMIDSTGGITIRRAGTNFGLTLAAGDSVVVEGTLTQFNGLLQMNVDTLIRVATGRQLRTPVVVSAPSEATENELIRINNLSITSGTWPAAGSNGFITVSNGTATFEMFIISILNQPQWTQPTGFFDVIAFGAQNDNSSPFTGNYQIVPMRSTDLIPVVVTTPTINFGRTDTLVNNQSGSFAMSMNILNPVATAAQVKVRVTTTPGATYGGTYQTNPAAVNDTITINVPANGALAGYALLLFPNVPVGRTDTLTFTIISATAGIQIGALNTSRVRVQNPVPPSFVNATIGQIRGNDTGGLADSIGVRVRTTGVVLGFNKRPAGLEFTIFDRTSNAGIGVFRASGNIGYNVTEGDSIRVVGTVGHFNGLSQINVDTVTFISANNTLPAAQVVTAMGENTESRLVRINNVTVIDPTQWPIAGTTGTGRTVRVTNGVDSFDLRIPSSVDVFGTPAPVGAFDMVGLGSQFDNSAPFTTGYQLIPRYIADIVTGAAGGDSIRNFNLLFPANNASLTIEGAGSTSIDIRWNAATWTGGAASFTYEWMADLPTGDFTTPLVTVPSNNSGADTTLTLNFAAIAALLDANGIPQGVPAALKWTVRARRTGSTDAKLAAAFSLTLTRGIMSSVENANPLEAMKLYPNPANNRAYLSYALPTASNLQLEVVNMIGKRVAIETLPMSSEGIAEIELNNLPEGVYFVRLSNTEFSAVRRLVVKH